MTVFTPLYSLSGIARAYQMHDALAMVPGAAAATSFLILLGGAETMLFLLAGAALWKKVSGAVGLAKLAFAIAPLFALIGVAGVKQSGLAEMYLNPLLKGMAEALIQQIIVSGIWLLYLFKSRRVQQTYGESTLKMLRSRSIGNGSLAFLLILASLFIFGFLSPGFRVTLLFGAT